MRHCPDERQQWHAVSTICDSPVIKSVAGMDAEKVSQEVRALLVTRSATSALLMTTVFDIKCPGGLGRS